MKVSIRAMALCVLIGAGSTAWAGGVEADATFERLKSLAGTWKGDAVASDGEKIEPEADGEQAVHEFRVSAGGTVLMEIMSPGTSHEMINMYHVDGDELLLTHYCAGGNQPVMRLDRGASDAGKLVFDHLGGTNLDPDVDMYIHSAELRLSDDGKLESQWNGKAAGEMAGAMTFVLSRAE